MPTAQETTTAIQDKVFAGIQAGQNAVVDYVRAWADTVETTFSKLPELLTAEPMRPSQVVEASFGFAEKVFSSQRDFATRLFEAAAPATQGAANAARGAANAASGAASGAANKAAQPATPRR